MAEKEVIVLCYWNGCIKYSLDGVYYEGSTPQKVSVMPKTAFSKLVQGLRLITGLHNFNIIGRYPVVSAPQLFRYIPLPVVCDSSLEKMLEVPSNHPSLKTVELYLEVQPNADDVINPAAWSPPMESPGGSLKRQRTQQPQEADGYANMNATCPAVKLERDNNLWIDDHELRVGLCFKDKEELKKAVDWCVIRGGQKCVVSETKKDEYTFECIRWKCNWSLRAARIEGNGLVQITKCSGPHTCCPTLIRPDHFDVKFAAEEIEPLIKVQPTLSIVELNDWWFEKHSYKLSTSQIKSAKQEVIKKLYKDWDQSFKVLPELLAVLHSSNGLLVDWRYDLLPNHDFASFHGLFLAYSQSVEGYPHCRPLIAVDTKDLKGKYPMKLMMASGVDADNCYFPLAFAVIKELCVDSWRWFLNGIREKVTQRKEICLISSPHPDILAVINEPGSQWKEPWAYHRFCLNHLCSQFHDLFQDNYLESLVDKAGLARQQDEFESHMETIKNKNPKAWRWLDKMLPHQWALAHDGGRRYGIIRMNKEHLYSVCESFQSLDLSLTAIVLLLFDEMRSYFLMGLDDSKVKLKCGNVYTRPVMKKLEEFMSCSIPHVITPLENGVFRVTRPLQKNEWIVLLSECTCTCGHFQSAKFPCLHALAVCENMKINPLQYVDDCYSLEQLYKTYAATFSHVAEVAAWPEASGFSQLFHLVIPLPPTNESGYDTRGDDGPPILYQYMRRLKGRNA